MKTDGLIHILFLLIVFSCSTTKEKRDKTDIVFGLQVGMKLNDVNRILEESFKKDSGSYYSNEHQIIHYRGTKEKKIEITFYKPDFREDSVLTDYTYTIQVITADSEYPDEFHKQILDQLQDSYGNAKKYESTSETESKLIWDLGDNVTLELTIDKTDNLYGLNYRLEKPNAR